MENNKEKNIAANTANDILQLVEAGIWKTNAKRGKPYRVTVSKRIKGKRVFKQLSVNNKTQALDAKKKLTAYLEEEAKNPDAVSFGTFFEQFLSHAKSEWSDSTYDRRSHMLNTHFAKVWVNLPINKITPEIFRNHFQTICVGKNQNSKREYLKCIRQVFQKACDKGLITRSPIDIKISKGRPARARQVLNEEQANKLLNYLYHYDRVIYYHAALALHTACRTGELRGLKISDVNFDLGTISISKTRDPRTGTKNSTKDGKRREIPINNQLRMILLEMIAERTEDNADDLLPHWRYFQCNEHGKILKGILRFLGLPEIRWYELRATSITMLFDKGTPVIKVMKIAGHSQLSTTQEYLRLTAVETQGATDCLVFKAA